MSWCTMICHEASWYVIICHFDTGTTYYRYMNWQSRQCSVLLYRCLGDLELPVVLHFAALRMNFGGLVGQLQPLTERAPVTWDQGGGVTQYWWPCRATASGDDVMKWSIQTESWYSWLSGMSMLATRHAWRTNTSISESLQMPSSEKRRIFFAHVSLKKGSKVVKLIFTLSLEVRHIRWQQNWDSGRKCNEYWLCNVTRRPSTSTSTISATSPVALFEKRWGCGCGLFFLLLQNRHQGWISLETPKWSIHVHTKYGWNPKKIHSLESVVFSLIPNMMTCFWMITPKVSNLISTLVAVSSDPHHY